MTMDAIGQRIAGCAADGKLLPECCRFGDPGVAPPSAGAPWKVLVIDDEEDVHGVTQLVLSDFSFDGRGIEFLHAHSGAEAMAVFGRVPDIAVALVDVVMETEYAGLDVVRYVRETLDNRFVRLILRTGHPGTAPERDVIAKYDINDYKAKTELSSLKLYSAMMTALRSYRDIMDIEAQRLATFRVLEVAAMLFQARSVPEFAALSLEGFQELLGIEGGAAFYADDPAGTVSGGGVLARVGTRELAGGLGGDRWADRLNSVADCAYEGGIAMVRLACRHADAHFLCAEMGRAPTALDRVVTKLFRLNATSALDNLLLLEKNQFALRQAIRALANLAPYRHKGAPPDKSASSRILDQANRLATGRHADNSEFMDFLRLLAVQAEIGEWDEKGAIQHVVRVGRFSRKLAQLAGMNQDFCEAIGAAGELHDVGKIFVAPSGSTGWFEPDSEKRALAAEHAIWGAQFLRGVSDYASETVRMAAEVARYHHETWDSQGYPERKAGEAIPVSARIVAIVDFFDMCISPRAGMDYRALSPVEAFSLIETAAGAYFDPALARLFLDHRREFMDLL